MRLIYRTVIFRSSHCVSNEAGNTSEGCRQNSLKVTGPKLCSSYDKSALQETVLKPQSIDFSGILNPKPGQSHVHKGF